MNERAIYPNWKKWILAHPPQQTELYELKFINTTKIKSFAFDRVDQHQVDGLLASLEGIFQRIMDQPWSSGGFQQKKLCDSMYIKAYQAWVVIVFYQPRKAKETVMIPVKKFIELKKKWPRKSIKLDELREVSGVQIVFI